MSEIESESTSQIKVPTVDTVQLDGLVLLKIIKHCKENVPELVMGQLLGLDINNTLEVTHSFPFAADTDEDTDSTFQVDMMKALKATNVDANIVGWYQSAYLSDFYTSELIQAQLSYQLEIPNSVVVIFDPFKTQKGRLAIKALRLSKKFLELNASGPGKFSPKQLQKYGVDSKSVFDELPIKIHNSHLVHAYLYELRETGSTDCTIDRLNVSAGPIVEKMVDLLSSYGGNIDEYLHELERYRVSMYSNNKLKQEFAKQLDQATEENERRRKANLPLLPLPDDSMISKLIEPSRLESVMLTTKIDSTCNDIISISSEAYQKQCVLKALMRNTAEEETEVAADTE